MSYPKYKYSKSCVKGKIFYNATEEVNAGDEWKESPAELFNPIVIPVADKVIKLKKVQKVKNGDIGY